MTQPKRADEIAYYNALRKAADAYTNEDGRRGAGSWGGRRVAICQAQELGIAEKRAFYLLTKWSGLGWIDYGTWAWGGWFCPDAPDHLD